MHPETRQKGSRRDINNAKKDDMRSKEGLYLFEEGRRRDLKDGYKQSHTTRNYLSIV